MSMCTHRATHTHTFDWRTRKHARELKCINRQRLHDVIKAVFSDDYRGETDEGQAQLRRQTGKMFSESMPDSQLDNERASSELPIPSSLVAIMSQRALPWHGWHHFVLSAVLL